MAGAGYKLYNTGDVLTAADVNTYLQQQTVMVFASSAARTSALSGVLAEGMLSYLTDTDLVQYYNGTAWTTINTDQTPLTTKGDLFTFSTTDARLAVGNNGETLVADSSASTGLRWQVSQAAGKNYCINGGFDIWQRSTSNGTTGYQTADRWYQIIAGTTTVSQSTDVPTAGQARYSAKITTSAGSSYAQFQYSLEQAEVIPLRGKTIVVSWYMKKNSTWSGDFGGSNYFYSNSTDARASLATNVTAGYSNPTGATPTTSWARYYETITIPSDAVGFQKQWNPSLAQNSGAELYIANVQFEIGSVPTAFTRSGGTLAGELQAAQRYYQVFCDTSSYGEITGQFYSTTAARFTRPLLVSLRTTNPTITFPSGTFTNFIEEVGVANRTPTAFSANGSSKTHITFSATGMTGATTNTMAAFTTSATAITISSEL